MNYEEMLNRAEEKIPEKINETARFEVPKVKGHIQGNRTIISNFGSIASTLDRKPEHLMKFILKELATPGELHHGTLILGRKVSAVQINEKIKKYTRIYVFCPVCGKPDTKLEKEGNMWFIRCLACGAKRPVPRI